MIVNFCMFLERVDILSSFCVLGLLPFVKVVDNFDAEYEVSLTHCCRTCFYAPFWFHSFQELYSTP